MLVERKAMSINVEMKVPSFNTESVKGRSIFDRLGIIDKYNPNPDNNPINFAFLVHPRDIYDVLACAKIGSLRLGALAKFISRDLEQWVKNSVLYKELPKIHPFFIDKSDITVEGYNIRGKLLAILLYGEQMLTTGWREFAQEERIVEAIQYAKEIGVRWVGLGALTSPATGGGKMFFDSEGGLKEKYKNIEGVGITNGNAFTAAVVKEQIMQATELLELQPEKATLAICGATGSVGAAAARLAVQEGFGKVILNGRSIQRVKNQFRDLAGDVIYSDSLCDFKEADIIVVMTNSSSATVLPEHVLPGTYIIDVTQPRNINDEIAEEMRKNGIIVCEGGLVDIPGYNAEFSLRSPEGTAHACLTETLMLALSNREGSRFSIGDTNIEQAKEMLELSKSYGIRVADPSFEGKFIPTDQIKRVKYVNSKRLRTLRQRPTYSIVQA